MCSGHYRGRERERTRASGWLPGNAFSAPTYSYHPRRPTPKTLRASALCVCVYVCVYARVCAREERLYTACDVCQPWLLDSYELPSVLIVTLSKLQKSIFGKRERGRKAKKGRTVSSSRDGTRAFAKVHCAMAYIAVRAAACEGVVKYNFTAFGSFGYSKHFSIRSKARARTRPTLLSLSLSGKSVQFVSQNRDRFIGFIVKATAFYRGIAAM